uniref:PNPLA domain-containing protein n=1 Tax=Spongospora subterranea TaxID=70186 RepID=A0A0H5RC80_9EUKA|eukprot:CRZ11830.1 hypothetical protein [Spongospora subterranea]
MPDPDRFNDAFDDTLSVDSDRYDVTWTSEKSFHGRFERGVIGMQRLFRWPLLLGIFAIIAVELVLYFTLRGLISVWESLAALLWDPYARELKELGESQSYQEWLQKAKELDSSMDYDFYRALDRSPFYAWKTVKNMTYHLVKCCNAINNEPTTAALTELETFLSRAYNANAAGLGVDNERLYAETFTGTKLVLQEYVDTTLSATKLYLSCASELVSPATKLNFVRKSRAAYGRTALCLSSGGTMAYYHFGVVRALHGVKQLPNIICGSSGGALIAALVGTRTDEELDEMLHSGFYSKMRCCNEGWSTLFRRYVSTGRVFDENKWRDSLRMIMFNEMTFLEAFQKTGRVLNITCTSDNKWGAPIVLNYLTAPNVVIWCSVLASSAVPPLLPPIQLLSKNSKGRLKAFVDFGKCWSDGCIKNDIPSKQLAEQFNVNYFIVSQVNPHIVPFVYECRGSGGCPTRRRFSGLRGGFLSSALEALLKLEMRKWLRMVNELDLMPLLFSQDWSSLFLQKHWGNVTIYPSRGWSAVRDFTKVITDPDEPRMVQYLARGEKATYPKIAMISNHLGFEQILLQAEADLLKQLNL